MVLLRGPLHDVLVLRARHPRLGQPAAQQREKGSLEDVGSKRARRAQKGQVDREDRDGAPGEAVYARKRLRGGHQGLRQAARPDY